MDKLYKQACKFSLPELTNIRDAIKHSISVGTLNWQSESPLLDGITTMEDWAEAVEARIYDLEEYNSVWKKDLIQPKQGAYTWLRNSFTRFVRDTTLECT